MKVISAGLSTHLDGEVTTLCSVWKIVRRDGLSFFFTDHDQDIIFEGDTYEAESSYDRTAIQSSADFSVDNLDVTGILDSTRITEFELRAGLFNRADVYISIINWKNPAQGALKVRRGWFGEVSLLGNGIFTTEIRGLAQALTHNFIEVYSAECRADFCDTRCKLNLADFKQAGTVTNKGDARTTFSASALPAAPTVGTSAGAHRYWSIKPTGYPAGSKFFIAEVRFRDQAGALITGGDAKDNFVGGNSPSKLRDGSFNSQWGFDINYNLTNGENDPDIDITDARWWIEFGTAKDIRDIEIIITDEFGLAFTAFDLQYRDAQPINGSIWTTAKSFSFVWTQPGQSAVWSLGSAGQAPINFAGAPQNLPTPTVAVSVYDGGSVEWTTGKNKGRVCEILSFVPGTNTAMLFEAMPYAIEVGDTFTIAQGCDQTLNTCAAYGNVINRRAEDYVPGNDELMNYPDAN